MRIMDDHFLCLFAQAEMTFAARSYVSDEYGMSDEEAGNLYAAYGFACTGVDVSCNEETNRVGNCKQPVNTGDT